MISLIEVGKPEWLTALPNNERPGFIDFIAAMVRLGAASFILLVLLYLCSLVFGFKTEDFSVAGSLLLAFCFLFLEEQARWSFIVNAKNKMRAALVFSIGICVAELIYGIFEVAGKMSIGMVLYYRILPTLFHFFACFYVAYTYSHRPKMKWVFFFLLLLLHVTFNAYGGGVLLDGIFSP